MKPEGISAPTKMNSDANDIPPPALKQKKARKSNKRRKNSDTANRTNERKKSKKRSIITVPYKGRIGSYTIDKEDCSIVQKMIRKGFLNEDEMMFDEAFKYNDELQCKRPLYR